MVPQLRLADGSLSTRVIRSLNEIDGIRDDWNRLLQQVPTASIFSTPEWLLPWFNAYGAGRELLMVAVYDTACERMISLAALMLEMAPVVRQRRTVRFVGDGSGDSDNLEILSVPGREREAISALLDFLNAEHTSWDVARFNTMPSDSTSCRELVQELRERGWTVQIAHQPCCAVTLPTTWDAYLQERSMKQRQKMRSRPRRLESRFRANYIRCSRDDIEARLSQLFNLHAKRWGLRGETGALGTEGRRTFYRLLSATLMERDWLEFWVLELNDIPVAAQYAFRYRDSCYSLQEGFDPSYDAESVGFVLRTRTMQRLIESGIRRYDFLGGVNESKLRWGAVAGEYVNLTFARPHTLGAAYTHTVGMAHRTKKYMRSLLSESVLEALRGTGSFLRRLKMR
jgi:CelD/BcsL family acetyltransferase involved in cellulose biosynthesis